MRDAHAPLAFDLSGRTALVTGASSGLGARMARVLAAHGAKVALAARREERLEGLVAEIEAQGGTAMAVALDVAEESQIIGAYDRIEAELGTVNTVVANAGIARDMGRATENAASDFDMTYAVNLRGVYLTAREGAKRMMAAGSREREDGRIVLVGSITADRVFAHSATYAATKAGVHQMGRVLATDWARMGISVNMIAPGYIQTEINEHMLDTAYGKRLVDGFPRKRLAEADSLDAALLWLCSDYARQVTGTVVTVDDGQSLG